MLRIRHSSSEMTRWVRPGWCNPRCAVLSTPMSGVEHESEVGVGWDREIDRSRARCIGCGAAVHEERRQLGVVRGRPGRAISTFTISPHTSTVALGNRLYCDSRNICVVSSAAESTPWLRRVLPAQPVGDDVADRLALGDRRHRTRLDVLGAHASALRAHERVPHDLIGDVATQSRARHRVVLVRDAVPFPEALRRVDIVDRPQHLAVDALHVVRLREAVRDDLPVACDGCRGRDRTAERVEIGPRRVGRHALEVVGERCRVAIEVHEHEPAPHVDRNGVEAELVVARSRRSSRGMGPPAAGP